MNKKEIFRRIPKIDEVLQQQHLSVFFEENGRETVRNIARESINDLRAAIVALDDSEIVPEVIDKLLDMDSVVEDIKARITASNKNNLYTLINGTGTILHTNLGRALLCDEAVENVADIAGRYSNLEYNVKEGKRGHRDVHLQDRLCELAGTEDAMMVNNNASATMLVLSSMGIGREIIVSRGELVEIGGSFRIPDIMEQSGAKLREVGTTNKTKIQDYRNAITEDTAALMKVHTSNYKVVGFTEDASLEELVELGKEYNLPVIFDMGNGLMINLEKYGLDEPTVPAAVASGIDVILFSGDKLLGGPQAGIISGKKEYISAMKQHPLARALRVDKMTFAAMEGTLKQYKTDDIAMKKIPVLNMITQPKENLLERSKKLKSLIETKTQSFVLEVVKVDDQIGGGSAPTVYLPGYAVAVRSDNMSTKGIERMLRKNETPIITRIHEDRLLLSARTLQDLELEIIADAFSDVLCRC